MADPGGKGSSAMIFTTTSTIQGREVERYLGVVFGDAVLGVNVFKDLLGGLRDVFGGAPFPPVGADGTASFTLGSRDFYWLAVSTA